VTRVRPSSRVRPARLPADPDATRTRLIAAIAGVKARQDLRPHESAFVLKGIVAQLNVIDCPIPWRMDDPGGRSRSPSWGKWEDDDRD